MALTDELGLRVDLSRVKDPAARRRTRALRRLERAALARVEAELAEASMREARLAATVWTLVAERTAARGRLGRPVTVGDVAEALGVAPGEVPEVLRRVDAYCRGKGLPLLSAIVKEEDQ